MKNLLVISNTNPACAGSIRNVIYLLSKYPANNYCILTRSAADKAQDISAADAIRSAYYYFFQKTRTSAANHSIRLSVLHGLIFGIRDVVQIIRVGRRAIKERNIHMIICVSNRGAIYLGTLLLSRVARVQYSLLIFDIYSVHLARGFLKRTACLLFENIIMKRFLFAAAKHIIVLNDDAKKFIQRTCQPQAAITVIHTSAYWRDVKKTPPQNTTGYSIVYTGSIYLLQRQSIINLIKAVKLISDLAIIIKIFTHDRDECDSLPLHEINASVSYLPMDKIPEEQSRADILFLPLSWNTGCDDVIETTTPGKLSEYLISGRPILVHAPATSSLTKYARVHGFAEIVDKNDIPLLAESIRKLLVDKQYGEQLVVKAIKTFLQDHDVEKNAKKFASLFSE